MSPERPVALRDRGDPWRERAAWALWVAFLVVTCLVVAEGFREDPVSPRINRAYETASRAWWDRESLYAPFTFHGFLYLPSSAILYTPLAQGPLVPRHLVARGVMTAVLVLGLAVLARVGDRRRLGTRFLLLTLVAIPLAAQNARQGQMNLVLTGGMCLATAALATRRPGGAAVALAASLAMKPLALVLILLAGAVHPRVLGWRLLVGVAAVALLPFAFGPPDYVVSQYGDFLHKMRVTSDPTTRYYEIRGLLETAFGVRPSREVLTVLRVLAAVGVFALALVARRRLGAPGTAFHLYALTACYLMLFNPKNEDPSYLILAPAIGLFAIQALLVERRRALAVALLLLPLPIALSWEIWGGRQYWFRPALALLFAAYVVVRLLRLPRPAPAVVPADG